MKQILIKGKRNIDGISKTKAKTKKRKITEKIDKKVFFSGLTRTGGKTSICSRPPPKQKNAILTFCAFYLAMDSTQAKPMLKKKYVKM